MLEEILGHCGVEPGRALMVGDSAFDLQMASNAGMHSVAVGYGAMSLRRWPSSGRRIDHFLNCASGWPVARNSISRVGEHG
jgi:phosphoglycolate phosphatase